MKNSQWKKLRGDRTITIGSDVVTWDAMLLDGVQHIGHEYANFVSSAEMRKTGNHRVKPLDSPINTHIAHAFLLNCRKMACFFAGPPPSNPKWSDIFAVDYVGGFIAVLDHWGLWKDAVDKQLAHITYTRGVTPREITPQADIDMENEIKTAWKAFLTPPPPLSNPYGPKFEQAIADRLNSEFYDLDLR